MARSKLSDGRSYRIAEGQYLTIRREWEMKYESDLYYVTEGIGSVGKPCVGKFRTFKEALEFVREKAK